jgi:hypothetical protein
MYGRSKLKQVKNVEVELHLPQDKPTIGKVSKIETVLRSKEAMHFAYAMFELINERTDKRAPMDRITSRSRYLYRCNVEKTLDVNGENKFSFNIRIPVHKEPSRNDKFICIKWQISLQAVVKKTAEDKDFLGTQANPIEFEVV